MEKHQLACSRFGCGFRADTGYFVRKLRFTPGVCPRCGGAIVVVAAYSDSVVAYLGVQTDPDKSQYREVVEKEGVVK